MNRAWGRFALENGGNPVRVSVGANYLDVCRDAAEAGDHEAGRILDALRKVLAGGTPLQLEYVWRTPVGERWFEMTAEPLRRPEGGALAHVKAALAVAPIFMSHGVQNKVLEAAAAGLPVVTTTSVLDGLPPEVTGACSIADTAEAFAAEVVGLLNLTPGERRARASRARIDAIDWSATLAPLESIVRNAASAGSAATRRRDWS